MHLSKAFPWKTSTILLLAVIQFALFFTTQVWALGLGVSVYLLATLAFLIWKNSSAFDLTTQIHSVLAICLSVLIWWRDDISIVLLAIAATFSLLWAVLQKTVAGQHPTFMSAIGFLWRWWVQFWYYTTVLPRELLTYLPTFHFKKKWSFAKKPTISLPLGRIFLGLTFALPVFFLLLLLFAAADEQFSQALEKLVTGWITWPVWLRYVFEFKWLEGIWQPFMHFFSRFVSFWLFFTAITPIPYTKEAEAQKIDPKVSYFVEKATAAVVIMVPFLAFIYLQLNLLPSMLTSFRTGAVNPALTIRESFGQLFLACAIGIGMVLVFLREKTSQKTKHWVLVGLSLGLLLEVFLVSVNAGYRLWVYQHLHGFTAFRITGGLLLGWLWLTLGWVALPLRKSPDRSVNPPLFMFGLLSFAGLVLVAGVINIHSLIMVKKPVVAGQIDWNYIHRTTSGDARHHYLAALDQLERIETDCDLSDPRNPSASCLVTVAELQEEYQTLQQFDRYMHQRFELFGIPNQYLLQIPASTTTAIEGHCSELKETNIPFWQLRGWAWHAEEMCQRWQNWKQLEFSYQTLLEQAVPGTSTKLKVLLIGYGNTHVVGPYPSEPTQLVDSIKVASTPKDSKTPLVDYQIVEIRKREESQLPLSRYESSNRQISYVNIPEIFEEENVCELVDADKVDEVWVWTNNMTVGDSRDSAYAVRQAMILPNSAIWQGVVPNAEGTAYVDVPPAPCNQTVAFALFDEKDQSSRINRIAVRLHEFASKYNPEVAAEVSDEIIRQYPYALNHESSMAWMQKITEKMQLGEGGQDKPWPNLWREAVR